MIVLVAGVVQGAAGFGFGLVALPATMAITGSVGSVPMVMLLSATVCSGLAWRAREDVGWRTLRVLLTGSVVGFPIGLALFQWADLRTLQLSVGATVLLVATRLALQLRRLSGDTPAGDESDPAAESETSLAGGIGVGALGGLLASSIALPGPPIVLYLTALATPKSRARATTLAFFVFALWGSLALQAGMIGVAPTVWRTGALLIPVALVGGWLGEQLCERLAERSFRVFTLVLIGITGVVALVTAF
ncbi:MAG: sulfite exporter TauE/SafE family protein [Gemmatimonadota bacterium]